MKIWTCRGQITLSKIDEIRPLAIQKQISTIPMHIPSLVKIDEIGPIAIPNQISTISIHISNLVKIHLNLLRLSSGNEYMDVRGQITPSNIGEILPFSNPKPDLLSLVKKMTKFAH